MRILINSCITEVNRIGGVRKKIDLFSKASEGGKAWANKVLV